MAQTEQDQKEILALCMMAWNLSFLDKNKRTQELNDSRLEIERLKSGVNLKLTHIDRFTFLLLYVPLNHLIGDIS